MAIELHAVMPVRETKPLYRFCYSFALILSLTMEGLSFLFQESHYESRVHSEQRAHILSLDNREKIHFLFFPLNNEDDANLRQPMKRVRYTLYSNLHFIDLPDLDPDVLKRSQRKVWENDYYTTILNFRLFLKRKLFINNA